MLPDWYHATLEKVGVYWMLGKLPLFEKNAIGYTRGVGCASDAQAVPHFDN